MSDESTRLPKAISIINKASYLVQQINNKIIKVNSGQGALTDDDKELFIKLGTDLTPLVEVYIVDDNFSDYPDMYESVMTAIYNELIILIRSLNLSLNLSRHNTPFKLEADLTRKHAAYKDYIESLIYAEREALIDSMDPEQSHDGSDMEFV